MPMCLKQAGAGGEEGCCKGYQGQAHTGPEFFWDFSLYYKKQGKSQTSFNWED